MTKTVFLHTYVFSYFLLVSVWRCNEHVVNARLYIYLLVKVAKYV